jgi:hypothetical protein
MIWQFGTNYATTSTSFLVRILIATSRNHERGTEECGRYMIEGRSAGTGTDRR